MYTCIIAGLLLLTVRCATGSADALNWASGASIVAPANVDRSNPDITINAVSCPSAGACTAVGSYVDRSGSPQGLLVTESDGSWRPGIEAQMPNSDNADPQVNLASVSCPSIGNCTAIGDYVDIHGWTEGVILPEVDGFWMTASEVADPVVVSIAASPHVSLRAVSCPVTGDCLIVGTYLDSHKHTEGLLETEHGGHWAPVSQEASGAGLPGNAAAENPTYGLLVQLTSVSCVTGACVAAGTYTDSSGQQQGLLVTGTEPTMGNGPWTFSGTEATLPGDAATTPDVVLSSVSCPSVGGCDAVGSYQNSEGTQGLLLTGNGGAWQPAAAQLPTDAAPDPVASLSSVSCASAGDCDAVGNYSGGAEGSQQGLLLTETSGSWGQGVTPALPADAVETTFVTLLSVSCSAPSSCAVAGNYYDDSFAVVPLLLSQSSDGSWSSPGTEPALPGEGTDPAAYTEAVSCAPTGGCAGIADYADAAGNMLAAAVNGTADAPTTPTVSLSAPPAKVTLDTPVVLSASLSGGAGETGTVTFGVFGPQSSPPASCAFGATAVGATTVMGDGAYSPGDEFTPTVAGDYWWYASYGGDLDNSPSASVCGTPTSETVVASPPAPTATTTQAKPAVAAPTTTTTKTTTTTTTTTTKNPTPTRAKPPTAGLTAVSVSGATVTATVVCHATARQTCTGSLRLLVTESKSSRRGSAKFSVMIGSDRYELEGATRRRLSVTLNRTGESLLRSRHKLTARLSLTLDKHTVTRTVTLRRGRR